MISSSELAKSIVNDLDQNAYTTWHDANKILSAINGACAFLLAWGRWPWNLTLWQKTSNTKTDSWTFDHDIFYPYWWELDWSIIDSTNIPIVWLDREESNKFYVNENVVRTKEEWLNLSLLYHRGHKKIVSLWNDDINIPYTMFQALVHLSLWIIYPGWMDIWSSLSNQNYNMAKEIISVYAKAYWFNLQPKSVEASPIYR